MARHPTFSIPLGLPRAVRILLFNSLSKVWLSIACLVHKFPLAFLGFSYPTYYSEPEIFFEALSFGSVPGGSKGP